MAPVTVKSKTISASKSLMEVLFIEILSMDQFFENENYV